MVDKVRTVREAAELVPDGAVLGVGGVMEQMAPVTVLLELVRRQARDLRPVTVATGISIDVLLAGRCAASVACAIFSYEDSGMSQLFRRRVEGGELDFQEHSELTLLTRLTAAMHGLPFLPTRGALGTDVPRERADCMQVMRCPFTGTPLLACAALVPDVSIVHVHRADPLGNAQLDHKHLWHDLLIARAARRVIVTAEEIVSTEEVRARPEDTFLPSFAVDAVVHAPQGAAPSGCPGRYEPDRDAYAEWVRASTDDVTARRLVDRWAAERAAPVRSRSYRSGGRDDHMDG